VKAAEATGIVPPPHIDKRTSIRQSIRMEVRSRATRTRTAHFVLRLNETERDILDRVAERFGMSASECMRYLIRRADEADGATWSSRGDGRKRSPKRVPK
jgi:hypothetical protein